MAKELDAAKYRILCEKEEMVVFMANYAPYAPIRRITNGASKGAYEVQLKQSDFPDAPYEYGNKKQDEKIFQEQLKSVCAAWTFGEARIISIWQKKQSFSYGVENYCASGILFMFAPDWTQQFEPETKPETIKETEQRVYGSRYAEYSDLFNGFVVRITGRKTKEYDGYVSKTMSGVFGCGAVAVFDTLEAAKNWITENPVIAEKTKKQRKRQDPRRKAPKTAKENGAFTGWTYNRLGTRQVKVCKW